MKHWTYLGLVAALAVLVQPAAAQHITCIRVEGQPELRQINPLDRRSLSNVPPELRRLRGTSSLARLAVDSTTDGHHGTLLRIQASSSAATGLGAAHGAMAQLYRLAPIPADLVGQGHIAPRVIPPGQLPRLTDIFNSMLTEDEQRLGVRKVEVLGPDRLKNIALPNGWIFRADGPGTFSLLDPQAGVGARNTGDPHIHKLSPGSSAGPHIGDWEGDCVAFLIPPDGGSFPTIVLAWSAGGSDATAYGVSKAALVLTERRWLYAADLDKPAPTGMQGDGALFAYQAFQRDLARAHLMYWIPSEGEFRKADGSRPKPPAAATQYTHRGPATRIQPCELFERVQLVSPTSIDDLPAQDREMYERFKQALAARTATKAEIRDAAQKYINSVKPYATAMVQYVTQRQKLVEEMQQMVNRLNAIMDGVEKPGFTPKEVETQLQEADRLKKDIDVKVKEIEALDKKTS